MSDLSATTAPMTTTPTTTTDALDDAIMQAAAVGDAERVTALMFRRATGAIREVLGEFHVALPDDLPLSPALPHTRERLWHTCAHCHQPGTTVCGALWRVSPHAGCHDLYYLHSRCLALYKAAHGLRSVEGRLPRVGGTTSERPARRAAPATHMAIDRREAL